MRELLRNLDRSLGKALTIALGCLNMVKSLLHQQPQIPKRPRSILVIKLVGLGDTVLMLTALDRLRRSFPDLHISALVTPLSSGILEGQPQIDDLIVYDVFGSQRGIRGFLNVLERVRKLAPNCTIDFEQHFQSTAILSYLIGSPMRIGLYYHGNPRRLLFTNPVFLDPQSHMLISYLHLLDPLGIDFEEPEELVPIWISDDDRKTVDTWLGRLRLEGRNLVGIHTGSGIRAPARRWSSNKFSDLIRRLISEGFVVVLTGSQDEFEHCEGIIGAAGVEDVHNAAGMFSIKQTAQLISRCDLFISNDTGPMHIAAAMGIPTVGLFGPESPKRYGPFGRLNRSVYRGAKCSPCVEVYRGYAPECSSPVCMDNITVEDLWKVLKESPLRISR